MIKRRDRKGHVTSSAQLMRPPCSLIRPAKNKTRQTACHNDTARSSRAANRHAEISMLKKMVAKACIFNNDLLKHKLNILKHLLSAESLCVSPSKPLLWSIVIFKNWLKDFSGNVWLGKHKSYYTVLKIKSIKLNLKTAVGGDPPVGQTLTHSSLKPEVWSSNP